MFNIMENTHDFNSTSGFPLGTIHPALYHGKFNSSNVCYSIHDDHKSTFGIVEREIFVRKSLDREMVARYNLSIHARICNGSTEDDEREKENCMDTKTVIVEVGSA